MFKNVLGIKELKGVKNINGNALIYAPNGSAKTSLAMGFSEIASGKAPSDIIYNNKCEYKFILSGNEYKSSKPVLIDNIVVYNFDKYRDQYIISENNKSKLSVLTLSNKLSEQYKKIYDKKFILYI